MSNKQYPLRIEQITVDGADLLLALSRGDHESREFISAVRAVGSHWVQGKVYRGWVKLLPSGHYTQVNEGVSGSFPATWVWAAGKNKPGGAARVGVQPAVIERVFLFTKGEPGVGDYGGGAVLVAETNHLLDLSAFGEGERGEVLERFRGKLKEAFAEIWGESAEVMFDFEDAALPDD